MTTFHEERSPDSKPIAWLNPDDLEELNKVLMAQGGSFYIDPYKDTKLLDAHVDRVLALPKEGIPSQVREVFEKFRGREFVYVSGD